MTSTKGKYVQVWLPALLAERFDKMLKTDIPKVDYAASAFAKVAIEKFITEIEAKRKL